MARMGAEGCVRLWQRQQRFRQGSLTGAWRSGWAHRGQNNSAAKMAPTDAGDCHCQALQWADLAVSGESANDRTMCALEAFIWHTQAGCMVESDPTWTLKRCTQRTDFFSSKRHMYQWDALDLPFHIRSLFQKTTTHRDKGVLKWVCSSCWWMWTDKTTGLHVSQKLQNGPVLWSLGIYPWKITQTFFS